MVVLSTIIFIRNNTTSNAFYAYVSETMNNVTYYSVVKSASLRCTRLRSITTFSRRHCPQRNLLVGDESIAEVVPNEVKVAFRVVAARVEH